MEAIKKSIATMLLNEDRFDALLWLASLSLLVNATLVYFCSMFCGYSRAKKNQPSQTATLSLFRFYYIRGVIFFRLLCYGVLIAITIKYWMHRKLVVKQAFFPDSGMSLFEVCSFSAFYYGIMILYEYDQQILITVACEALIHLTNNYILSHVAFIVSLFFSVIAVRNTQNKKMFGRFMNLLQGAIMLPGLASCLKIYRMLT